MSSLSKKQSDCALVLEEVTLLTRQSEALLRMVAPGAGFRGVTLGDVTTFMKIMSQSR